MSLALRPNAIFDLVILGNLEAMRTGDRYLEVDMNRLFSGKHANYDECEETRRAAYIEQQVSYHVYLCR